MKYADKEIMRRCLALAQRGSLWVTPNPMVGCVIVKDGRVIAEGFHERFGGPHAEIHALRRAGDAARGATLYVNLEPCSHYGKTPPCVGAIINAGVARVVASIKDPNPLISGKGFEALRKSGIAVESGLLAEESAQLNERFVHSMSEKTPFVGIKIAQTMDGKIADVRGKSKWITGKEARKEGHRLRAEYESVLVGVTTAMKDNPLLTTRLVRGRNPIRIILDGRLSIKASLKVLNLEDAETIVVTSNAAIRSRKKLVDVLKAKGVQVMGISGGPMIKPAAILRRLAKEGISSVLIEGGGSVTTQFLSAGLFNKVHAFVAPRMLGGGKEYFSPAKQRSLSKALALKNVIVTAVGYDVLIEGYPD
jgi:diaminohydroxyphosphoribosylaminopyrimidine deaminase/5-amino-6-(5-phosphoribosylamino)uracil reductase